MDKAIFFSGDVPASTASDMVRRKEAVRLATGVYATVLDRAPDAVVRDHWPEIAGHLLPDAVITDRSARRGGPIDGVLYLAHGGRDRNVKLPGLTISARNGVGPLDSDVAMPGGLHLASPARGLLENAVPSRSRSRAVPRRLTTEELGDWVDHICRHEGEDRLNAIRDRAHALAADLGLETEVDVVDQMVGAALGTRDADGLSRSVRARRVGRPYDQERIERFDILVEALRMTAPQSRTPALGTLYLPFFEAYFSNFIEGTEFTIDEAVEIVYENKRPLGRTADAHDIEGTYEIVSNDAEMRSVPSSPDEFLELLKSRHAVVMKGRPDKHPGRFKDRNNQAGATLFVPHDLVEGTLIEAFARRDELDTAWERAVLMSFIVSEVHPFDDGNGRVSRIMMNAELVHNDEARIIIATVFREDYLGGLRRLSRNDDSSVLIKALRYAQDWTSRIDFSDLDESIEQLTRTNALREENQGFRLLMPQGSLGEVRFFGD